MSKDQGAAAPGVDHLKSARDEAIRELAEDAKRYLDLVQAVSNAPGGSDDLIKAEAELEVQVTVLRAHSTSLSELIDQLDEALNGAGEAGADTAISHTT